MGPKRALKAMGPKRALKGIDPNGFLKGGGLKKTLKGVAVGRWPSTNFVTLHAQSILECPTAVHVCIHMFSYSSDRSLKSRF